MVNKERVRVLKQATYKGGPIVYVMGRDFRAEDNWALLFAQELAIKHKVPLCVLVHFGKNIVETNDRQHSFLVEGLEEVSYTLEQHNIPFFITFGDWKSELKEFVAKKEIGAIVTDFSPLREQRWWWNEVSHGFRLPIYEVDAHNVIPAWILSDKEEFAAHTIRRKVKKLYENFSGPIPALKKHLYKWKVDATACWPRGLDKDGCEVIDWQGVRKMRTFEIDVAPITWCQPGPIAAKRVLERFIKERIKNYAERRNDPMANVISDLSPYIRHGFISTQRIAHEVSKLRRDQESKQAFLEELIVRRELAENYCLYNEYYDSFSGLRDWAQKTLNKHRKDTREFIYSFEEFERAETHDDLWNAAQMEMVKNGKMHGYMRMYWAKKILEWTKTPEEAITIAVTLNDRYSIDGRDPNGYVGVLWSIGGIHDRAWVEREVFGKIRFMNYNGSKRKFDVKAYIEKQLGSERLFA